MHSDLIGKIEKARYYANEPERVVFTQLTATFRGGNNGHTITLIEDRWLCDCAAFRLHGTCAHTMAMQKLLAPMLSEAARADVPLTLQSDLISMIEKSRHYIHEPERVCFSSLQARFRGSNNDHTVTLSDESWLCDCTTFRLHQTCAHTMALQRILRVMLSDAALQPANALIESTMVSALT
ncbi:MAG TPA: hypothetical protein PKA05_20925 [Roseiflexaceae bacterium]|nr:hypothetical protein [Roseiflexaceae bacterium]HMP42854.1 hypothetical protein [Roseiflexaceae bacterium]